MGYLIFVGDFWPCGSRGLSQLKSRQILLSLAFYNAPSLQTLRFRVPGIELKNPSSLETQKKKYEKATHSPIPGRAPKKRKTKIKKYENGPQMTVFLFFCLFFSYFRGPIRRGGFRHFFLFFLILGLEGFLSSIPGTRNCKGCTQLNVLWGG